MIKLKLALDSFDESRFTGVVERSERSGISFETMASLGDTTPIRMQLYQLNKICSADIPARGEFFTVDEFFEKKFAQGYDPSGVIIALSKGNWIGMSANSNWQQHNFIFNEMTGVLKGYRRQGIALALKLLGIKYAQSIGVDYAYTIHDAENSAPIELNRRLGYIDAEWEKLIS